MSKKDWDFPVVAVRMIIRDEKGGILLLRRAEGGYGGGEWCLPGGKVDYGQTVEDASAAARRWLAVFSDKKEKGEKIEPKWNVKLGRLYRLLAVHSSIPGGNLDEAEKLLGRAVGYLTVAGEQVEAEDAQRELSELRSRSGSGG